MFASANVRAKKADPPLIGHSKKKLSKVQSMAGATPLLLIVKVILQSLSTAVSRPCALRCLYIVCFMRECVSVFGAQYNVPCVLSSSVRPDDKKTTYSTTSANTVAASIIGSAY